MPGTNQKDPDTITDTITITSKSTAPEGRVSSYTPEIAAEICAQIMEGVSLRAITEKPEMPPLRTVMNWLAYDSIFKESFWQQYTRAREIQADTLFDDCLYISEAATQENWQIARLRIQTRQWMAGKLKPKVYGDLQQVDISGGVELSIAPVSKQVAHKSPPQIEGKDAQDAR